MKPEETLIMLKASIVSDIYTVIKAAADRGSFKLEEYGAIAALIEEIKKAVENNRIDPAPTEIEISDKE